MTDGNKALKTTFKMDGRGRLHWLLGLRIRRGEGKVTVDQERYKTTKLERFQTDQCKASRTLLTWIWNFRQHRTETKKWFKESTEVWLDHFCSWPNKQGSKICSQSKFRHLNVSDNIHWLWGKQLLRHLRGSKYLRPTHTNEVSNDLVGESYKDWSGNVNDKVDNVLLYQAQRTWLTTQLRCRKARRSCSSSETED